MHGFLYYWTFQGSQDIHKYNAKVQAKPPKGFEDQAKAKVQAKPPKCFEAQAKAKGFEDQANANAIMPK